MIFLLSYDLLWLSFVQGRTYLCALPAPLSLTSPYGPTWVVGRSFTLCQSKGSLHSLTLAPYCDLVSITESMQTFHSLFRTIFTSAVTSCMNALLS